MSMMGTTRERRPALGATLRRFSGWVAYGTGSAMMFAMTIAAAPAQAGDADIAAGRVIAVQGAAAGQPACAACHMADGAGQPEGGIPALAGLNAGYIRDQLTFFAEGQRTHPIMQPFAKMLTAEQRGQVAAYFASLPVPAPAESTPPPQSLLETGRRLFQDGDFRTGLLACASCHGPDGQGVGDFSPRLAGQSATYVTEQLNTWKAGNQRDPNGAFMRAESGHLSDADIAAVAAFIEVLTKGKDNKP